MRTNTFAMPEFKIFLAPESPEQDVSRKRTTRMHSQKADNAQHHFRIYQSKKRFTL